MAKWRLECAACGHPVPWEPKLRYWFESFDGDGEPCEVDIDWTSIDEGDIVTCAGGFCPGCSDRGGFVVRRR
jgi:hypothetical protein